MKGAASKEIITNKILETFPNSFKNEKELRIPMMEDGSLVEIKVTLTCAKENISEQTAQSSSASNEINFVGSMNEPTEDEKQRVKDLMNKLGI